MPLYISSNVDQITRVAAETAETVSVSKVVSTFVELGLTAASPSDDTDALLVTALLTMFDVSITLIWLIVITPFSIFMPGAYMLPSELTWKYLPVLALPNSRPPADRWKPPPDAGHAYAAE